MEQSRFFVDLGLLLLAALIGGGVAHALGQPLIVGYLVAGVLVGPFTPGPTISDPEAFRLFAEVGVVLLLFTIGIEFSIQDLFRAGRVALYGAPLGILVIILLTIPVGRWLGWPLAQSLVVGATVSVASTMVLLKFLLERGDLDSLHGRIIIGITLAEDLAVVAMTVLIRALEGGAPARLVTLGGALLLALLILVPLLWLSRHLVPALLGRVARTRDMELFLLVAMAIAIGTAALTSRLGLSLALGAFLAGLVISESEFAHEALSRILPVRDIFVAVFFVSVGTFVRPTALVAELPAVILLIVLVVVGKFAVWSGVIRIMGLPTRTAMLAGLGLTQIGEFSYVLAGVGREHGLLTGQVYDAILATSVVTIAINALIFRRAPRWLLRLLQSERRPPDVNVQYRSQRGHVVLCGFGRVGREVARAFEAFKFPYAVVDLDPAATRFGRERGAVIAVFGDAGNERILRRAGVGDARLAVVAIPDFDAAHRCVGALRTLRPDLPVIVRVHHERYREALIEAGASEVIQPEVEAALTIVRHSLDHLGVEHQTSRRYLERIREHEGETAGAG